MLQEEAKTHFKVVGGFANDNQATLWLEGKQDGDRIEGRINLHRENGAWKLGMESSRNVAKPSAAE